MKKKKEKKLDPEKTAQKNEEAMIAGILEGSPDGIGVAVVRLTCGCKKMAAVDKEGEPASKVIIYRDSAEKICDLCTDDDGAFSRVADAFIHWQDPKPNTADIDRIEMKVLGNMPRPTSH